jgi:hypothetical protein
LPTIPAPITTTLARSGSMLMETLRNSVASLWR